MKINHTKANTILNPTGINTIGDYVINPYKGCSFGCLYCYAANLKSNRNKGEWGTFVFPKVEAHRILDEEIKQLPESSRIDKRIIIGSTCDPYQPVEKKLKITSEILSILKKHNLPFFLMTKSPLCVDDLDKFQYNRKNRICFTVNEDVIIKSMENSYSLENRLKSFFRIFSSGADIYLHFGPFFPFISNLKILSDLIMENLPYNWNHPSQKKKIRINIEILNYKSLKSELRYKVESLFEGKYGSQFREFLKFYNNYQVFEKFYNALDSQIFNLSSKYPFEYFILSRDQNSFFSEDSNL